MTLMWKNSVKMCTNSFMPDYCEIHKNIYKEHIFKKAAVNEFSLNVPLCVVLLLTGRLYCPVTSAVTPSSVIVNCSGWSAGCGKKAWRFGVRKPRSATTRRRSAANRCSMSACSPAVGIAPPSTGDSVSAPWRRDFKTAASFFADLNYVACLKESGGGGAERSELVIFSSSTPGNFTREQCNSVCFTASHRYGGLGGRHECLCSTNSEPNFISESQCSAACTNPQVMEVIGALKFCLICCKQRVRSQSFPCDRLPYGTCLSFADKEPLSFLAASEGMFDFSSVVFLFPVYIVYSSEMNPRRKAANGRLRLFAATCTMLRFG